jgi:uncharacterized protein (DUF608 family)
MKPVAERIFNNKYTGSNLDHIAFPMGGIGAGMISLSGTGSLLQVSLKGSPEVHNEPYMMSAIYVQGSSESARVIEGPVPDWKYTFPNGPSHLGSGNGGPLKTYGLPRFTNTEFNARFPFAEIQLSDEEMPVKVSITGWSPFVPGDADASSLPVAALEYNFVNTTDQNLKAVYSFHSTSILSATDLAKLVTPGAPPSFFVEAIENGILLKSAGTAEEPWGERTFCAVVDGYETICDYTWFRGDNPLDPMVNNWRNISKGLTPHNPPVSEGIPSMGASIYVPFELSPGEEKTICLKMAWYTPITKMRAISAMASRPNTETPIAVNYKNYHKPWYAGVHDSIDSLIAFWVEKYAELKAQSKLFSDCFFDSNLPSEVLESISANLSILKSPTMLRQTDGRIWAYEGCYDEAGCCPGSCTHVWNYAQAVAHLFPDLERGLRQTEYREALDLSGHQQYRISLPISPTVHDFHSAADGQLGGIMKVYREWRISGDTSWLSNLWKKVRLSLDYCINTWDPRHVGVLEEPHHNTYDIEFWGPDSMTTTFYLGALKAAILMGEHLNDNVTLYRELYEKGRKYLETELWNGEYFFQRVQWKGLNADFPPSQSTLWTSRYRSPENMQILEEEGPKYQYGSGCLSDGVLGAWMARVCGLGNIIDPEKEEKHLLSVYKYNFKKSLAQHANPVRSTYASSKEGGLLLCTWPYGGQPVFPFFYAFEVWTGIEYQVASHLSMIDHVDKALEIVRTCRSRYDGRIRNPFDEMECGHWYARALASYGLLQGLTGARYDALDKTLFLKPSISGDFQSFFCTESGYGVVGVKDGEPFYKISNGTIDVDKFVYQPK